MTTYTYTTLSDPSAALLGGTEALSINDRGQVTGYYFNGITFVGFLYSDGTWTNLSDPSAAPGEPLPPHRSMTRAKSPASTITAPPT